MIPHMPDITSAAQTRRVLGKGFQLFASTQAEPRARRPTDIAMAIVSALAVAICIGFAEVAGGLRGRRHRPHRSRCPVSSNRCGGSPSGRRWSIRSCSSALPLLRGRRPLARDIFGSFVIAVLTTAVIAAFVMDDDRGVVRPAPRRQRSPGVSAGRPGRRHRGDLHVVTTPQPPVPPLRTLADRLAADRRAVRAGGRAVRLRRRPRHGHAGCGDHPPRVRIARRSADRVTDQGGPRRARRVRRRPRAGRHAAGRDRAVRGERSRGTTARQGLRARRVGCPAAHVAVADGLVSRW